MNGIRIAWSEYNGENKLRTMNGKEVFFGELENIANVLPRSVQLDGFLWLGDDRESYEKLSELIQMNPKKAADWTGVKLFIYDSQSFQGTYKQRLERLQSLFSKSMGVVGIPSVENCQGKVNFFHQNFIQSNLGSSGKKIQGGYK